MRSIFSCACLAFALALGATTLAHAQAPATPQTQPVVTPQENDALYDTLRHKLSAQVHDLHAALSEPEVQTLLKSLNRRLTDLTTWENHYQFQRQTNPNPMNMDVAVFGYCDTVRNVRLTALELEHNYGAMVMGGRTTLGVIQEVLPEHYKAHEAELLAVQEELDHSLAIIGTAIRRSREFNERWNEYFFHQAPGTRLSKEDAAMKAAKEVLDQQLYPH